MGRTGALGTALLFVISLSTYLTASPTQAANLTERTTQISSLPPAATFNKNLLLQGSSNAAEPSIRTDQFGQAFVIAPTGVPAGCKAFRVKHDGSASVFLGFPDHGAGGGDCDWAIGPQETSPTITPPSTDNVLAYSSLTLPNITTGKSDDAGTTFSPPNVYSQQVPGDDRMWMTADPKLNSLGFADVYMTYHDVSVLQIELGVSRDGGLTYLQNGPIINAADVPPTQWGQPGGNGLGNIVAYRPKSGALTLFSIFVTPDSALDNANQGVAGTSNFNRIYEAVGTVTDVPAPGAPLISWRNYEVYHGPIGARYDRIFPITAVDAAGKVYAIWTDGNHIIYKTDATGSGWNPSIAPGVIANPTGVTTTIMPWAQAGASDIVDVVFYAATGGSGAQPNPQDDVNNLWDVYMAQTIDGGSTWGVFKASDHQIHTGPICIDGLGCNLSVPARDRTLLDFIQVSIDPTNGAADIAYADDHAAPGNAVLYFTRQCTGASATTGLALVNDCVAPAPPVAPPQGTTCPGPQILDFVNDAPNNYPAGMGQNMDNLDIENAFFGSTTNTIEVTLTIKNLQAPPTVDNPNILSGLWTVYWQQVGTANAPGGSKWWFAQATTTGTGGSAVATFSDGTFDVSADSYTLRHSATGSFTPGPNGTFVIHVPRTDVGSPANGATLTNTFADTAGAFLVLGTGLRFIARADRAPDAKYGANYIVAQTCAPPPPPPPSAAASLTLAPKTETDDVFTQASETATVKDASANAVPGVVVRFTVTGANPGSGSQTTDQFGQAVFSYTGQNAGIDTITAYADKNNNGVQDPGEPSDTATKTWVVPSSTPGCEIKITGGGSIIAANGDQGTFGGNAQITSTGGPSGQEQYQDHGPAQPLNAHSINVTSIVCSADKTQASIYGQATIDGSGSYVYRIVVQDNGNSGPTDAYGIRLSNGYDSGLQSLRSGNVDIHKS
jgi:hypothetical protein